MTDTHKQIEKMIINDKNDHKMNQDDFIEMSDILYTHGLPGLHQRYKTKLKITAILFLLIGLVIGIVLGSI